MMTLGIAGEKKLDMICMNAQWAQTNVENIQQKTTKGNCGLLPEENLSYYVLDVNMSARVI